MFCPNCGAYLNDGTRFCSKCGSAQTVAPPVQARYVQPAPSPLAGGNPRAEQVRNAVRKLGGSPLFLIVCICYTLAQLISLLTLFIPNDLFSSLYPLLRQMGMSYSDIQDILAGASASYGITGFLGMIPGILIMSGLWMVYGTCLNRSNRLGTGGLTMIQVINILYLVFFGLAMLILLIVLLIAVAATGSLGRYGNDMASAAGIGMLVAFFLIAGIAAFIFVYYIKILTTISKVKETIRTGIPNRKVSGFVAVMCFISGGFSALGGLISITGLAYANLSTILAILSSLLSGTLMILIGVLIFLYKSKMRQLEEEMLAPPAPAYAAPQPAPRPAPQPVPQPVPAPAPVAVCEVTAAAAVEETVVAETVAATTEETVAETVEETVAETVAEIVEEAVAESIPEEATAQQ